MVQTPGRAILLLEAPQPVRVLGEGCGQHLDRHLAAEARVASTIDLAHAPRPQRSDDLVGSEP